VRGCGIRRGEFRAGHIHRSPFEFSAKN
jgi:hypothetical protein